MREEVVTKIGKDTAYEPEILPQPAPDIAQPLPEPAPIPPDEPISTS
jgi:hypothetical protein